MLLLTLGVASAGSFTWTGGGADDLWTTAANWGGTAPTSGAGDDLTFPTVGAGISGNPDPNGNFSVNSITFSGQNNGSAWVIDAFGDTVTIGAGGLTTSGGGNFTINASNTTLGASQTWAMNNGNLFIKFFMNLGTNNLILSGANAGAVAQRFGGTGGLSGSGNITLNGSGTFHGFDTEYDNSSWSGNFIANGGLLSIRHASGLGDTGGTTTINSGASLVLHNSIAVGAESITINGSGESSNGAIWNDDGTNSISGAITIGSNSDVNVDSGSQLTLSGAISDGGTFFLNKNGDGTLILSGNSSTMDSGVVINNGILTIENANALGNGTQGTTINSGGTLGLSGGITTTENIAINGTGESSSGAVWNDSGTNEISGTVTVQSNSDINVDSGTQLTLSGAFSDGATYTIDKTGDGTLVLSGNSSTMDSGIEINNGILTAAHANALGNGTQGTTVFSGGTLGLSGGITLSENIALNGTGEGGTQGALWNDSGDNTFSGTVTLGSDSDVNVDAGTTLTLNGSISDVGTTDFEKTGTGTLTLGGTITTDTITVTAGTLMLGASDRIADTTNMTLAGGTFSTNGFDDTLANLTLTANSVIDMGDGNGSHLRFSGTVSGIGSGGGEFGLSVWNWSGNPYGGNSIDSLFMDGTTLDSDALANITFYKDSGTTAWTGSPYQIPVGTSGEVLPTIPEPSTWLGGFGVLLLSGWHWRRRAKG